MVKPLSFKGDKKTKKRKHREVAEPNADQDATSAPTQADDQTWSSPADASELAGPALIVLPTRPATCLAFDPLGNVFASRLENLIEGDAKTAEPDDVQQVWVASRIAGMAPNEINFKSSHGGYLSCDQYGILGAKREARGREEAFFIDSTTDDDGKQWFQLRCAATTTSSKPDDQRYLSAVTENATSSKDADDAQDAPRKKVSIALRGDGETSSPNTLLILRMQSSFKPQSHETKESNKTKEKISRQELEAAAGRTLNDEEARRLKKAKREGTYHSAILDIRAKGKHDKYA